MIVLPVAVWRLGDGDFQIWIDYLISILLHFLVCFLLLQFVPNIGDTPMNGSSSAVAGT